MARLLAATTVLLGTMLAGSAWAQTVVFPQRGHPAPEGTTRVHVEAQLHGATADEIDAQRAMQETLRHALYDIASKECALLESVFKRNCVLASLTVSASPQYRVPGSNGPQNVTDTLRADFDLAPARAP
ncbi:MAG TPA: hypothetical protein VHD15_16630 [Hyphomicrobiales bacterium]|nr:hypothetical protein [Hyphomicrobiales bacterium]